MRPISRLRHLWPKRRTMPSSVSWTFVRACVVVDVWSFNALRWPFWVVGHVEVMVVAIWVVVGRVLVLAVAVRRHRRYSCKRSLIIHVQVRHSYLFVVRSPMSPSPALSPIHHSRWCRYVRVPSMEWYPTLNL